MKYHDITHDDMKNGDGLRVVLWVSGCSHHCPGCQNPITWDPNDGKEYDLAARIEIYKELQKDYISGLTISGGDPFYIGNILETMALCRTVKQSFIDKTVWVYTGYTWEFLQDCLDFPESMWKYIDVLVDGEFEQDKLDVNYPWAGSTNQRVIDVQESLKRGKVVLYASDKERRDAGRVESRKDCGCGE